MKISNQYNVLGLPSDFNNRIKIIWAVFGTMTIPTHQARIVDATFPVAFDSNHYGVAAMTSIATNYADTQFGYFQPRATGIIIQQYNTNAYATGALGARLIFVGY